MATAPKTAPTPRLVKSVSRLAAFIAATDRLKAAHDGLIQRATANVEQAADVMERMAQALEAEAAAE